MRWFQHKNDKLLIGPNQKILPEPEKKGKITKINIMRFIA
jgi:hypothetical protein